MTFLFALILQIPNGTKKARKAHGIPGEQIYQFIVFGQVQGMRQESLLSCPFSRQGHGALGVE